MKHKALRRAANVCAVILFSGCSIAAPSRSPSPTVTPGGSSAPARTSPPGPSHAAPSGDLAASPATIPPSSPSTTPTSGPSAGPEADRPALALELVADGFAAPDHVTGTADGRLWVVEQEGRVRVIEDGVVRATPVLDLTHRVACCGERGMLSLAFHPDHATNDRFYVSYSDERGDLILGEFTLDRRRRADPASERVVLRIPHREHPDHWGGMLEFADDGTLLFSTGDGGGIGDRRGHAQDLESLLGKILRIEVDGRTVDGSYGIPADNPFVGVAGRDEIWSYGLRNPWRFSLDAATGELWVGDVGQDRYEEISRHPDGRGANFGWNVLEGRHCYSERGLCDRSGYVLPVVEYRQVPRVSQAILGGYVYRGSRFPDLRGWYVFAESYLGLVWAIPATTGPLDALPAPLDTELFITSFGTDASGELLLTAYQGGVYRVTVPRRR